MMQVALKSSPKLTFTAVTQAAPMLPVMCSKQYGVGRYPGSRVGGCADRVPCFEAKRADLLAAARQRLRHHRGAGNTDCSG
nr:hypothetical protein [Pseudomonas sp. BF-R-19]